MRYLCFVSYNGAAYQGWQKQLDSKTIQGTIEETFSQFFNQEISIQGSGRTDAGVHAKGQTFHFDLINKKLDKERFLYSINQMLPKDITINDIKEVSDDFHARFSAIGKEYNYLITYSNKDVFDFDLKYNCLYQFDHKKLNEILTYFVGTHNFQNFTSKEEDEDRFIRTISSIEFSDDENKKCISIIFKGNGFMRYMIRYIVGTALAYAEGKISKDEIVELLNSKERKIVSYKAPAEGLYLMSVSY